MRVVVHVRALVTARALHARHPGCWGGDGDGVGLRSTTCARCGRCAFTRYLTALLRCLQAHGAVLTTLKVNYALGWRVGVAHARCHGCVDEPCTVVEASR